MIENKQNRTCKVHNARFYTLAPRAINYMAYNKANSQLALAREDASIEIWDTQHAPHIIRTIPGSSDFSVEAIGWAGERLFSAGLTGELVEWDLQASNVKQRLLLTGNAAWCLDVARNGQHLAVGTEGGFVNIFDVSQVDEVNYVKIFDKQEGKIICCQFDHSGDFVVTGSADTIRVWQLATGHAVYKMSVGRSEAKKEAIVWSLRVLKDFSIIAGDSRGYITVWNGKLGAQVDSIQAIKSGSVLAVAVSDDEKMFVCAGVDAKIRTYSLMEVIKEDQVNYKWVKFIQRFVHEHDVKALAFLGDKIFSGGVDGFLGTSYSSKSKKKQDIAKYGPFLQQPCISVAEESRVLLLRYVNYIELWRLGVANEKVPLINEDDAPSNRKFLTLEEGLEKLVELRSNNDVSIVSSSISPNAAFLVYSTIDDIRLFRLSCEKNQQAVLKRLKNLPAQFEASARCLFSPDSQSLFLVKQNRDIDVFSLPSTDSADEVRMVETIETSVLIKDSLNQVEISHCGQYLVCSGLCGNIGVWKLQVHKKKSQWKHLLNLPKYKLAPTALAIHRNTPKIVVSFADSKIFEYDLIEAKITHTADSPFIKNQAAHIISNIVLDPRNEHILILQNDSYMFVLKKQEDEIESVKKSKTNTSGREKSGLQLKTSTNYEHLLALKWFGESEILAIGVNPVTLLEQLPPAFRQKLFGVS